jgi:hypothetical protein
MNKGSWNLPKCLLIHLYNDGGQITSKSYLRKKTGILANTNFLYSFSCFELVTRGALYNDGGQITSKSYLRKNILLSKKNYKMKLISYAQFALCH